MKYTQTSLLQSSECFYCFSNSVSEILSVTTIFELSYIFDFISSKVQSYILYKWKTSNQIWSKVQSSDIICLFIHLIYSLIQMANNHFNNPDSFILCQIIKLKFHQQFKSKHDFFILQYKLYQKLYIYNYSTKFFEDLLLQQFQYFNKLFILKQSSQS